MTHKEVKELIDEILDAYEYEFPTMGGPVDKFITQIIPNIIRNYEEKPLRNDEE